MSGEQKQRIQLARAVYNDADIYLFDDPFSAVEMPKVTSAVLIGVYALVSFSTIEIVVIIGIMASITWQVLIVAIPATLASKYVQGYYQASAREIIRINGTTKAPVMNFAAETSLGMVTVRAFNMVDRFVKNYLKHVDTDASLFFHSNVTMERLILRIETLQNLTVFTAALLLILVPMDYVFQGLVGLSLSYAFTLTQAQIFWTRWFCNLSNYVISLKESNNSFTYQLSLLLLWNELIHFLQYLERYRPNAPIVLKGITCTFKEGSRVGVVVRTGSGKTIVISALFRLVEPLRGNIIIDEIDICSLG
ncbi:hypothetical protein HN51_053757 [Arachis hypogaea]